MATKGNPDKHSSIVVNRDGFRLKLTCSNEIVEMLNSSSTDGSVKELIINQLIEEQHPHSSSEKETATPTAKQLSSTVGYCNPATGSSSTSKQATKSSSTSKPEVIHIWTDKRVDMIVHAWHERRDEFQKNRNNNALWVKIVNEVNTTLKCNISVTQVINKYNNLKKRLQRSH